MPIAFKIKTRHLGASQIDQYVGSDGKVITKKLTGLIEDQITEIKGRNLFMSAKTQRERTLFMSAVFFQRVVSRTPLDEDYSLGTSKSGKPLVHHADNDSVRFSWYASYNNRKVTAKQLKEAGVTFDNFNDEGEIKTIYEAFRTAFIMNDKKIMAIHVDNNHKRFPMLEYGEYTKDGTIKKGPKYEHGVEGGFSIQAPAGMLRITQAEFQKMSLSMSTKKLIKTYVQRSQRTLKNPSPSKLKELKRVMGNKTRFDADDLSVIERIYNV